jgi:alpha-methylacyl-CoA racemase
VAAPGQDAAAILADWGWTWNAIATLQRDNIV